MGAREERDPGRVYYTAGGFAQSRPILTGPDAKQTFDAIPSIDFSDLTSPSLAARQRLAEKVGNAAQHVGFFYATNAPVTHEIIDRAFEVIDKFFHQPDDVKMQIDCAKSNAAKGYQPRQHVGPFGVARESFSMGNDGTNPEQQQESGAAAKDNVPLNQFPDGTLPEFRKAMYQYYHEVFPFAKKMIQIFALALGLPETALDQYFRKPLFDITMQHYPVQSTTSEPAEILHPHADFGAVTLLLQNKVSGLQVLNANGIWIPAPPVPYAFVINTGNYVEAWTNGRWPATVHRVYASLDQPRFSLPFFMSPSPDVVLSPLQELLEAGEAPKYDAQNIGQRHVKGMLGFRSEHPMTTKLRKLLKEEDWRYEMLSRPDLSIST